MIIFNIYDYIHLKMSFYYTFENAITVVIEKQEEQRKKVVNHLSFMIFLFFGFFYISVLVYYTNLSNTSITILKKIGYYRHKACALLKHC